MANTRQELIDILMDELPEAHPWEGRVCDLVDALIARGVTVNVKKAKPPVDLTNKCGSCKHSVVAVGVFGDSPCYVRCTNKEHLSGRHYQEHPIAAVRQRTAKACKKYEPRSQPAEEAL